MRAPERWGGGLEGRLSAREPALGPRKRCTEWCIIAKNDMLTRALQPLPERQGSLALSFQAVAQSEAQRALNRSKIALASITGMTAPSC